MEREKSRREDDDMPPGLDKQRSSKENPNVVCLRAATYQNCRQRSSNSVVRVKGFEGGEGGEGEGGGTPPPVMTVDEGDGDVQEDFILFCKGS